MSYNDYMYAVDRSDEYLAHYGIKGMKWGVQKALQSGSDRKLARQYKKAQKKLAKLEKRAANGSKYAKRAAALGAGAALAGGAAALGTERIGRGIAQGANAIGAAGGKLGSAMGAAGAGLNRLAYKNRKLLGSKVTSAVQGMGTALNTSGQKLATASKVDPNKGFYKGAGTASQAVMNWGKSNSLATGAADKLANAERSLKGMSNKVLTQKGYEIGQRNQNIAKGISNNTIARVGAGALAAGLAGAAGYNAYRAATTKKAAAKAQQFRSEMNKAFAGTKYANGGNGSSSSSKKRRRR